MSGQGKQVPGEAILGGWDNEFVVSDVPRTLGLLTQVITWFGDDRALGMQTGQIPPGYDGAKFRQWLRGVHSTDSWFQCGPYQLLEGVGGFRAKLFGIIGNRASGNVLYTDIYDYTSGATYGAKTFALSDFPTNSDGFVVFYPSVSIQSGHRYETRVRCLGAASVSLYMLRWEVDTL
jgi:hypothetical protein